MSIQPDYKVRLFYKVFGKARYISHLSVQKTMIRALFRSGIRLEYSQGFNPHPKISFAQPLPVYCESDYEIMDITLKEPLDYEIIKEKLNQTLPKGIEIFDVSQPIQKISLYTFARYRFVFETLSSPEEIKKAFDGELWVLHKTKSSEKRKNIAPCIYELSVCKEYLEQPDCSENARVVVEILLGAGEKNHVNPGMIEHFLKVHTNSIDITRIGLYNSQRLLLK